LNARTCSEVTLGGVAVDFFLRCGVFANNLSALWKGRVSSVPLASRTPASAVAAPLRARFDRQPGFWRCLCGRNRGILNCQSTGAGGELQSTGGTLPAIHEDLEFGRGERQSRG